MKRSAIMITSLLLLGFTSCKKYLEENPRDFLTPAQFYTTPAQVQVAVNGAYSQLQQYYQTVFLGLPISDYLSVETLTGYGFRTFINGEDEQQFTNLTQISPTNSYVNDIWKYNYQGIEQCNSVITNVGKTTVVDDATKNKYLGEVYFLRAYYYFKLVRLFGDIPLKITPTVGTTGLQLNRNNQESVYNQIVSDLLLAEQGGLPDVDATGHISQLAVKSLLAKVYLTMAGYPLLKGAEFYQKAYDKASEVINTGKSSLFPTYADWSKTSNKNIGENIFMVQFEPVTIISMMHYSMLPYPPAPALSAQSDIGGGLAPDNNFYNSYAPTDERKAEKNYFYNYQYPNTTTNYLMIYKYWDQDASVSGKSGQNMPVIRYADVELIAAEAKANIDGGTTSDPTAVNAYYDVHHRAFPASANPGSITVDQILQERFWEFCYEDQTWYDMIRTRKAMNVPDADMVPLIGYKAPQHTRPFAETDMVLPLPQTEIDNNPKITEPPI